MCLEQHALCNEVSITIQWGAQSDVIQLSKRNVLRFIRNVTGKEFTTDIYKGGFQMAYVYQWTDDKKRTGELAATAGVRRTHNM